MTRGYVQIYTGCGKGKTTCCLGLALRAAGAGNSVFIGQFVKSGEYSEIKALKKFLPQITVEQYGAGGFIMGKPSAKDIAVSEKGFAAATAAVNSGNYDLVILDECNVAVSLGLLSEKAVLGLMETKPIGVELVLTGRGATKAVMASADLVTEMTEIKHYYHKGVEAREGIES